MSHLCEFEEYQHRAESYEGDARGTPISTPVHAIALPQIERMQSTILTRTEFARQLRLLRVTEVPPSGVALW